MTDQPIRQYPDERREQAETDMLVVVPAESEPPCCTDPTCACDQVNEAGRCECARWDDDPAELTAEEARDLADELGTDLYRAQDALAFVGECCDIADREQRPITTADVREWLKGAQCGRQLAASNPRLYREITAMFAERPATADAPAAAHATAPARITDPEWLRQQYAAAMYRLKCPYGNPWENTLPTDRPPFLQLADAILAVRDRELERLADVETNMQFWIDQHKRARQSAFDQRQRAKTAEEQRDQLAALVRDFRDPDPCRLDHHGYCQAHSWMCSGNTCPHARAREILAALDGEEQP